MKDYIVRAVSADKQIRVFAARTTKMVDDATKIHNLSPVCATALGRLLTGGALMGAMLKNDDDVLTLQIECQGPIKGMVVTSDSKGNVKGYVNDPSVYLPLNKPVTDVIDLILSSNLSITSSDVLGISCTIKPPAHLTLFSWSRSTPKPTLDGVCSLSIK